MTKARQPKRQIIRSLDEIPDHFDSEDEEREWWATHEFSEELLNTMEDTTAQLNEILAGTVEAPPPPR